jgi:hypothetical protein
MVGSLLEDLASGRDADACLCEEGTNRSGGLIHIIFIKGGSGGFACWRLLQIYPVRI